MYVLKVFAVLLQLMLYLAIQGSSYPPSNFSEPPPFTFCPTFGDGDELGNLYGPDSILRTRAHLGSSERIRKVIRRAMSGLPISQLSGLCDIPYSYFLQRSVFSEDQCQAVTV